MLFLGLIALAGYTAFLKLYGATVGLDDVGGFFLLYGCLVLVVRIFGARLPDRLGPLRGGTLALGGAAAAMIVIAAWPSVPGLVVGTVVFAFGMSMMYPNLMTLALVGVDESAARRGRRHVQHLLRPVPGIRRVDRRGGRGAHELPRRVHRRGGVRGGSGSRCSGAASTRGCGTGHVLAARRRPDPRAGTGDVT